MSLTAGSRLGPYEILAPLGAGGMGEVYRAKDTRLERTVAVKVLPQHLSASADLRERFEREAKTISRISHPHICALYDVNREGETEYLVMELLEGETLAARLERGALPLDQALRYSVEIADALDFAHRQGIVHRDLKPANVMLTRFGVKLLDFGLAKVFRPEGPVKSVTSAPTAVNVTREGTFVGTWPYMAPEQLEGREADARTDIFAFGAVLYEMATGRAAFSGTTQATLIGAILHTEPPPISMVQPMAPPAVDRVVKTCLSKDPDDRFQTAHDLRLQVQWIVEGGSQAGAPAVVASRRKSRERVAWGIAAAAVLAGAATFGYIRRAPVEAPQMRLSILPPAKASFDFTVPAGGGLTVSPDGRRVTFIAKGSDGKSLLYVRALDDVNARPLAGAENASWPFWSPDSRFIAFFADGKLQKVDVSGAPPLAICDAPAGRSGSWNREGVILFSPDSTTPIYRVSASGGAATPVTSLDGSRGETTHRWATFLPDGRHFLYMAGTHAGGTKSEANAVYAGSLDSKDRTLVLLARSNVTYASGNLLYLRERVLLAQPFDARRLRLTGDPVPVAENVVYDPSFFRGALSASENGVLVYASGGSGRLTHLVWYDRAGKRVGDPIGDPAAYDSVAISPDGQRFAATMRDTGAGNADIWLGDFARGSLTRFTFGPFPVGSAVWSPDGSRIAFSRLERGAQTGIFIKPVSGSGQEDALLHADATAVPISWSRDGRFISYTQFQTGSKPKTDVWILPLTGDRKPFPFLATAFNEFGGWFSPDGHWILYRSDESGKNELYAAAFPGPGGKWEISKGGALDGSWNPSGGEIIYTTPELNVVSVPVRVAETGLDPGIPKTLFKGEPTVTSDMSPDGQRFLEAVHPEGAQSPTVTLVSNWTAALRK